MERNQREESLMNIALYVKLMTDGWLEKMTEKSVNDFMKELRLLGVSFEFRATHNDGRVFQSKHYRHVDCSRAVKPYVAIKVVNEKSKR